MQHHYQTLLCKNIGEHIALIAMNRPAAANALSQQLAEELKACFTALPPECRVVILTGTGKHFCAGADLKERKGMSEQQWHAQHHALEEALHAVLYCHLPVIAAVNGAAFGGGLELALACDFIYASATARFALSETTLGIMPGMGGTQHLPRAIGAARASELIFTGKPFSSDEAYQWGMVNMLCPSDILLEEATATAHTISANAPLAVKTAKKAINQGFDLPLDKALACELTHYNSLLNTNDRQEGINAFNDKRKPHFSGT